IDGQGFTLQCLHNEVRDHAAVIRVQAGTIGIEDPHQMCIDTSRTVIGHYQRFGKTLGLVVYGPRTDRVYIAPVALRLRMFERLAVALRSRGMQITRSIAEGNFEG